MKKYILVVAVVMLVVAVAGSTWAAVTTQTVNTTAQVLGLCKNGTNGTLTFAPIDPSGVANVTASSLGLTYSCSNGTTFNITGITGGSSTSGTCASFNGIMTDGGGHTLNYALTCAGGPYAGLGFTNPIAIVLNGTITPVQFQNAFAATYTDTVTVEVTY
jgi:spore coat protein U-like protein